MGKIFYLMGKSSSGKDTIYNQLIQKESLRLKKIVLYTTRPRRTGETNGIQYYFVDDAEAIRLQQAGKVIAKFMQMGEMHAINDVIDFDTAALLAEEFHAKVEHEVHVTIEERLFTQEEDAQEDLVERPPVLDVCSLGVVDGLDGLSVSC